MPGPVMTSVCLWVAAASAVAGGPYVEIGVNGYIDPITWRHADPSTPRAVLNPIFRGWATEVIEYAPSDQTWSGVWNDPAKALGPVTGDNFDIVSLGELTQQEITEGAPPGHITLTFGNPDQQTDDAAIPNVAGYDFVVFENGMMSEITTTAGSIQGQLLAELAYVEVSSDGQHFVRFPSVCLTPGRTGAYGTSETTNIHNLAGKHPNGYGVCLGTPFDLQELADHPDVVCGTLNLDAVRYLRIVDVPGSGDFTDDAGQNVEPGTGPQWRNYAENHPIYDQWPTWGSGGFDLEAVGVLREQQYSADVNLDGIVDHCDLSLLTAAWLSEFGGTDWNGRCDLSKPEDLSVDLHDFATFAAQWRHVESWRAEFKDERGLE